MRYLNILVTGGAGFVGSNLCIKLKQHYPNISVTALDNLIRRGSELNLPRLKKHEVQFIHGDVRNPEDLSFNKIDLIIDCSAEPSVMAGVTSSPEYLLNTNLMGAINCFELARKKEADVVFLSTSRVYPVEKINKIALNEKNTRYEIASKQTEQGISKSGINEKFSLEGIRSLYGTSKLTAELILQEYAANYGINAVINRFGLIAGPWQMGKIEQGVIVLWMARHIFKKKLSYIGFGGKGKQVRDVIHIDDVFDIVNLQIKRMKNFNGQIYNIGGGEKNSVSLIELTKYCEDISGNKMLIKSVSQTRQGDIKLYITDNSKINKQTGWKPKKTVNEVLKDIYKWINENQSILESILIN
jgi:CDP-paratose 2-epimerase